MALTQLFSVIDQTCISDLQTLPLRTESLLLMHVYVCVFVQYVVHSLQRDFLRYLCCENILTNDKLCSLDKLLYHRTNREPVFMAYQQTLGSFCFVIHFFIFGHYIYRNQIFLQTSGLDRFFFNHSDVQFIFYISYSLFLATRFF